MAESVGESGFWLPAEFLDELYTDEPPVKKGLLQETAFDSEFCFPKDFPYETSNGDEKSWVMSTSPQSTLSRLGSFSGRGSSNGSPNGVTSPPTTPLPLAVEDLIHRAVGQVERLKLSGGLDGSSPSYPKPHNVAPPRNLQQMQRETIGSVWYGHQHQQASANRKVPDHVPWANPARVNGPGLSGPANNGVRACAGTGVFLPRRYDNDDKAYNSGGSYAADSRRKTVYTANMGSSDRTIRPPPTNKNMGIANNNGSMKSQPRFGGTLSSNYDILMARRTALMLRLLQLQQQQQLQQRRNAEIEVEASRGIFLPQEWTY